MSPSMGCLKIQVHGLQWLGTAVGPATLLFDVVFAHRRGRRFLIGRFAEVMLGPPHR